MHFLPAGPKQSINVPLKSGLTNFSACTDQAISPASKEKFSAGVFCFFICIYIFNGIQASFAGLFDTKKKGPIGGGEPRQELAMEQKITVM